MVKRRKNQRFEDHLCPHPQVTDVFQMSYQYPEDEDKDGLWNAVFSPFNHLTWLVAWEYFIEQCCCESCRLYTINSLPCLIFKVLQNKVQKLMCCLFQSTALANAYLHLNLQCLYKEVRFHQVESLPNCEIPGSHSNEYSVKMTTIGYYTM
jgi:hypothetical protein